jgi:hypothetical protein
MSTLIIFTSVGIALAFLFRTLKNKAIQKSACYKLYSVRDDLICLVAEGKLEENGRLFQYYYKRINRLLELAPDVGLDNAMEAFLFLQNSSGFEHSLKEANRRADEMLELAQKENEEVSEVIANYYLASKSVMLAHSSILRMLYICFVKKPVFSFFKNIIPKETYDVLKTVSFADEESHRFRHVIHHQAA